MNYAIWGGYTTPDQYLGYLQRQRTALAALNDVLLPRASLYRDNASAALSYANALAGTHETRGDAQGGPGPGRGQPVPVGPGRACRMW